MSTRIDIDEAKTRATVTRWSVELMGKVGRAVHSDARRGAPVDTGELVGSLYWTFMAQEARRITVRIGAKAGHARYVERGTRYMAAQPFLRPALYAAARVSTRGVRQ